MGCDVASQTGLFSSEKRPRKNTKYLHFFFKFLCRRLLLQGRIKIRFTDGNSFNFWTPPNYLDPPCFEGRENTFGPGYLNCGGGITAVDASVAN